MFRDIRKKKNQISTEAAEQLLREARRGILAVNGREGYPYAIPINYYYDREAQKIYFHGARADHKAEAIRACDKVCFTVCGGETIREEAWAPYLRSVVVFGRCRLLEQSPETMALLKRFAMKYYPEAVGRRGDPAGWRCRPALRDRDPPPQRKRSAGEVSISSPVCSCRNRKRKTAPAGPMGLRVLLVRMFITNLKTLSERSRVSKHRHRCL